MHDRNESIHNSIFLIVDAMLHCLMESNRWGVLDEKTCAKFVHHAVHALKIHIASEEGCRAACMCLGSLFDYSVNASTSQFAFEHGSEPLVRAMVTQKTMEVQQNGLKVIAIMAEHFPQEASGALSIRAIIDAMQARPDNLSTQRFGCGALRNVACQGPQKAEQVREQGTAAIFAAIQRCEGDMAVYAEALGALEVAAVATPEGGRRMGVEHEAVPALLAVLPHVIAAAAAAVAHQAAEYQSPSPDAEQAAGSEPHSPKTPKRDVSRKDALRAACSVCRSLRTLLGSRLAAGASYERLFHAGVCREARNLVRLLCAFPFCRDLTFEVLPLLAEAAEADSEGAFMVGEALGGITSSAKRGGKASNILITTLQRFHADEDCIAIFGLAGTVASSDPLAESLADPEHVREMLRWVGVHLPDRSVQHAAVKAFNELLKSDDYSGKEFLKADGLEALIAASSRHGQNTEIARSVAESVVLLSGRCPAQAFYTAFAAFLRKFESNGSMMGTGCRILCGVMKAGDVNGAALLDSGTLNAMLKGIGEHRGESSVADELPVFVDIAWEKGGQKVQDALLQSKVGAMLVDIVQGHFHEAKPEAGAKSWIWHMQVTAAYRRMNGRIEAPAIVAASFRALGHLLNSPHWQAVASSGLVTLLMRVMAVTSEPAVLRPASSLLASIFRMASEHVTWTACNGTNDQEGADIRRNMASATRTAIEAEEKALQLWCTANFLQAAAKFRAAAESLQMASTFGKTKQHQKSIQEHIANMNLEKFALACEQQHKLVQTSVQAVKTGAEFRLDEGKAAEDCPICLEALAPGDELWMCQRCKHHAHEDCMERWREKGSSCPMCRQPLKSTKDFGPFHRAKKIAEAAEQMLMNETRGNIPDSNASAGFMASAVASLWQTAAGIGTSLQVGPEAAEAATKAAHLARLGTSTIAKMREMMRAFTESVVSPCEQAVDAHPSDLAAALRVVEAANAEILQRHVAWLAQDVANFHAEIARLLQKHRFAHADNLIILLGCNLSEIKGLLPAAQLTVTGTQAELDEVAKLREQINELRRRHSDQSTGVVGVQRASRPACTPFAACLSQAWRRDLGTDALEALRAILAFTRASHEGMNAIARSLSDMDAQRAKAACDHIVWAVVEDGIAASVSTFLSFDGDERRTLLAVAVFQQLLFCGKEARDVAFSQLDRIVTALVSSRAAMPYDVEACLCGLVHQLIFQTDAQERMVRRLHREAVASEATSLEEWFLDTLLVQHGATAFTDKILGSSEAADAWILCWSTRDSTARKSRC